MCIRDSNKKNAHLFPWRIETIDVMENNALPTASISDASNDSLPPFMTSPLSAQNKPKRLAHLMSTFKLDKCQFLPTKELQFQAAALLLKYWDTFSWDGTLGCAK